MTTSTMEDSNPTVVFKMGRRGFCGCCSLREGAACTGLMATIYNGALIYWFFTTLRSLDSADDFFMVLTILLEVLMFLAAVHIVLSLTLVYAAVKEKAELVMLWVVVYIASCCIVSSLFTIGLAFMMTKVFLYIIFCNCISVFNIVMALRLYKEMIANSKKDFV